MKVNKLNFNKFYTERNNKVDSNDKKNEARISPLLIKRLYIQEPSCIIKATKVDGLLLYHPDCSLRSNSIHNVIHHVHQMYYFRNS